MEKLTSLHSLFAVTRRSQISINFENSGENGKNEFLILFLCICDVVSLVVGFAKENSLFVQSE